MGGQSASWMREDGAEAIMQSVNGDVIPFRKLIEQPEHPVHFDPFGNGELAQASIACEQSPLAGFRDGEGECIRGRETCILAQNGGRPTKLCWRQDLDPKSQRH